MDQVIRKDTVVYDIETIAKRDQTGKTIQKFASAVVYSYQRDEYLFYLHESGLRRMIRFMNGKNVISFYGIAFDSKVALGNDRLVTTRPGRFKVALKITNKRGNISWIEYDIFLQALKFVRAVPTDIQALSLMSPGGLKLDQIARQTINQGKTGHGSEAPNLYKHKKYDELLAYNLADVRLTKKLYEFIKKEGYVKNATGIKIAIPYSL